MAKEDIVVVEKTNQYAKVAAVKGKSISTGNKIPPLVNPNKQMPVVVHKKDYKLKHRSLPVRIGK